MNRRDDRLNDEIRHHLDLLAAEYESRGMSPENARHAARRAFGAVEPMKEQHRDQRGLRWVEDLVRDVRYGLRALRRHPGLAVTAILTLALGIGATAALFTVIDAVLLKPLPVDRPDDLRLITVIGPDDPIPQSVFSYPVYQDMRQQVPAFAGVALFGGINRLRMTGGTDAGAATDVEPVSGQTVSGNFFSVLGVRAATGRLLGDADDRPAAPPAAVLSDGFWARRFGRDPSIVGRAITINNVPLAVVGVAPRSFAGIEVGAEPDLWFPVQAFPQVFGMPPTRLQFRGSRSWRLIARLRVGVSAAQAEAQAEAVDAIDRQDRITRSPQFGAEQRAAIQAGRVRLERAGAGFTPLRWQFRRPLLVLMSVVVLVLVIACANVANLLLARAVSRDREMAVRMALGSGRRRLMQQLLVESALLAAAGGVLGIGVAAFGSRIVATFLQTQELSVPVSPDLRVLAFTLAVSFLAAFIAGVIPAVTATRLDLARRDARAVGNVRLSTHHALVTAQVALSLVVVVVAGLFLRTLTGLQRLDIGFDRDQLITASLDVPRRSEPTAQLAMYQRMLDRLNAVAGQRAAISMFGMLSGNGWSDPIRVPGYTAREGEDLDVQRVIVSSRFFEVTGMRIVAGRPFGPTDDTIPTHAAIVNETVARRFFRGNAVGARFSMGDPYEVVGVVKDSFYRDLRAEAGVAAPIVYISALQAPGSAMAVQMRDVQVQLRVESAGDIEPAVRTALRDVDPGILVSEVRPMRAIVDRTIARERLLAQLAGWLGIVALALGAIGIYGVRAYAVNRRVSEFGVRMALGAAPRQIARGVVAQGVRVASIGIGIGLIGAAAVTPLVKGLLFGVAPLDLATFVTAAALFVGVAVTASYLPARRATRIDPVAALRSE